MFAEENKAILRRLYDEGFTQWNLAVIDEGFSPTYVGHELPPGTPPGPAGLQELYAGNVQAFPASH